MVGSYQKNSPEREADAAALRGCRSRGSGAPAGEQKAQGGARRSGECARVLGEARGGAGSLEFARGTRRSSGKATKNGSSLVAPVVRGLGGKRGKTRAVKWAWSRGGVMRPLTRIDRRRYWLQRQGVISAG